MTALQPQKPGEEGKPAEIVPGPHSNFMKSTPIYGLIWIPALDLPYISPKPLYRSPHIPTFWSLLYIYTYIYIPFNGSL